jgi:metal-responsive CopG/Arc/MetJ family transcriptional regulator
MPIRTKHTENKEKVGTVLDKDLLRRVKERSAREGRTISDIIQDALIKYNDTDSTKSELRRAAVNRFCSRPFNLNTKEINDLLNEDIYES